MKVSLVVLTWNHLEDTVKCLKGLMHNTIYPDDHEIIVVDNGSTDGTAEYLKFLEEEGEIKYVSGPDTNFSEACNAGIIISKYPYIVLMNNDTWVTSRKEKENLYLSHWLQNMLRAMESRPDVGIMAPTTNFVGKWGQYLANPFCCKPAVMDVDVVNFVCVILKREVVDDIGYLDEEFECWFQDDEYCHRAKEAGWNVAVNLGAFIWHRGEITTEVEYDKKSVWKKDEKRYKSLCGVREEGDTQIREGLPMQQAPERQSQQREDKASPFTNVGESR